MKVIEEVKKEKLLNRVLDKITLSSSEWEEFVKDMALNLPKRYICLKYNIKPHYFKILKKYFKRNPK